MAHGLVLPIRPDQPAPDCPEADAACTREVTRWFQERLAHSRRVWQEPPCQWPDVGAGSPSELADAVLSILTHRCFNFRSRQNIQPLLPKVRQQLAMQLEQGGPVRLFLLYNGGYRASPWPEDLSLVFEPDQTEWMLIHQIGLLQEKVRAVHAPGVEFWIVVNNGVAHWVNGISLALTERYATQLRQMLADLGASGSVRVLLQSELAGFEAEASWEAIRTETDIAESGHRLVERFLGRHCSRAEAAYRAALYMQAEARWADELAPVVAAQRGLVLRQVAHPDMLSFRPFPGGAIRVQNGTLGFQQQEGRLVPKLVTTEGVQAHGVHWVRLALPGQGVSAAEMNQEPVHA